ncbi:DNA starvation/stationary phase protection protein, partial [Acinetobacter baumannii]|uniref:DNA starvation/stationary phase protection protein n=1 Tax=Acinetobacter baumannii TaxID=470 RepID=UPI000AD920BB
LEIASVKEASNKENAQEMVQSLISDFEKINQELKDGMELADKEGDEVTGDMLLAIHSSLEKHIWMLTSFLG